jgi:aspartyl-tRNA(Asn)/glutamyl-tRNA(Gln) amidotransferase subunit C
MKINEETLERIAHLARLDLNASAKENMIQSLNQIVDWVDKLKEVDTSKIEPLTHLSDEVDVFRPDNPEVTLSREELLKNAPEQDGENILVPKVLDN